MKCRVETKNVTENVYFGSGCDAPDAPHFFVVVWFVFTEKLLRAAGIDES